MCISSAESMSITSTQASALNLYMAVAQHSPPLSLTYRPNDAINQRCQRYSLQSLTIWPTMLPVGLRLDLCTTYGVCQTVPVHCLGNVGPVR